MRFDYYSATVPSTAAAVVPFLLRKLPYEGLEVCREKGVNSFANSDAIRDARGDLVCSVLHGGVNPLPHVRASGIYTPDVVDAIRASWPEHSVSRLDSAIDFDGTDAWNKLYSVCETIAGEQKLKFTQYGDFRPDGDASEGRTIYVGSRKSQVMVRLYEKGKQILATASQTPDEPPSLDWCRLENEVKPLTKTARQRAATLTPAQVWGCSPWSRRLLSRAVGTEVERVTMRTKRYTDAEEAIYHMLTQYRGPMEALIAQLGSEEAFMRFCRDTWRAQDERAQRPAMAEYEHRTTH